MWLLMGMVVAGIYVLPGVTAKFQGSHTMEFNESSTGVTNATEMDCGACHAYIQSELNATGVMGTAGVIKAHIRALNDRAYTNDNNSRLGGHLQIGNKTILDSEPGKVCPLCHATETKISGSHTQVVTRVCTDADCHGYNSTHSYSGKALGTIVYGTGQNITEKLNKSADMHSSWYWAMESVASTRDMANSSYPNSNTGKYGQGYLTCLACHTHFGMNLNITRPQSFNITISINAAGAVAVSSIQVNQTDVNETMSYKKAHDSVWW
ncbi:hypothetical protein KKA03_03270 [archaeon]|nr:hypothetical protein [archaeon]